MDRTNQTKTDWRGVLFGLSAGFLAAFQQFKLPPTLPLLLKYFGYAKAVAGGFMSIYAVAGLAVSVPAGRILARRGPRGLLTAAFVLFLGGNAIGLALPSSGAAMLFSRLLEGIGFAVLAVVGAVVTTTSAAPAHRPLAIALWATWIPVGQVAGTALAIPAVSAGAWRPLWWASALSTATLWIWGLRLQRADCQALAAARETRSTTNTAPSPGRLDGELRFLMVLASILFGLWSSQYITYVTWLPQYLVEAHGMAPGAAARAYLIPSVLVIMANLGTGALLRRGAPVGRLLAVSILFQGLVWFLIPLTRGVGSGIASLVTYGLAAGVTATALFALPGFILGNAASRGFAAMMAGRNLGVLVGPILLAQVVSSGDKWRPVPPLFGGLCVATFLLTAYLSSRIRRLDRGATA